MIEVILGVFFFVAIVLALVAFILAARKRLVASGTVPIEINGEKTIAAPVGSKLLGALADAKLFVSSACGGGGSCGQCKVKVLDGGGARAVSANPARPEPGGGAWRLPWLLLAAVAIAVLLALLLLFGSG